MYSLWNLEGGKETRPVGAEERLFVGQRGGKAMFTAMSFPLLQEIVWGERRRLAQVGRGREDIEESQHTVAVKDNGANGHVGQSVFVSTWTDDMPAAAVGWGAAKGSGYQKGPSR